MDGVKAAVVPAVPDKLQAALLNWHGKVLEVGFDTFVLLAGRQDAPLTEVEVLVRRLRQLEGLAAVLRHELRLHYEAVQASYSAASA